MANLFEPKDRRVLPNLRSFRLTANLGELNDFQKDLTKSSQTLLSIDDYLLSWDQNKTIAIAGDLISAAFVNGFTEYSSVKEAASFILANQNKSTNILLNFAENIINPPSAILEKIVTLSDFEDCNNRRKISNIIREIKHRLKQNPINPILYVELSRLYANLGYKEKALQNISIALNLAPENRFVLRAAARVYTHFGLEDCIHHFIQKSNIVKHDPWIASAEIALATIMNRSSRLVKNGLQMIKSGNYSPFSLTELAASIGTLEFLDGNKKKTKHLLRTALISPNDNSLAQAEWILNKQFLFELNPVDYDIKNKYEASARDEYHNEKWDQALSHSLAWFCDLPFSKIPVMFGSHIANDILDKQELGRELLLAGLISHPNDVQIINNLAYSFALENKLKDAESYIGKLRNWANIDNPISVICLIATSGLIAFRKGLYDEGRFLYRKAINETKILKNKHFQWLAELNYAREEILSKSDQIESAMNDVNKILDKTKYPNVNKLKIDILKLYEQTKK